MKSYIISFLIVASFAMAQFEPVYKVGQFGQGEGGIYLSGPAGISADYNSDIYVCDADNNRIVKYFYYGEYITSWSGDESGSYTFNRPLGIQVAYSDNPMPSKSGWEVYVTDCYNYSVRVFDLDGNLQREWNAFRQGRPTPPKMPNFDVRANPDNEAIFFQGNPPIRIDQGVSGIAIDSATNVYVGDTLNNYIVKFDSEGNYITEWSTDGWPAGLCVDQFDNLYVVHNQYHYISKYDSDGNWIKSWGSKGGGNSQMYHPAGIYAHDNSLFLCDYGNHRVQKFGVSGYWTYSFGQFGYPPAPEKNSREQYFNGPVGIVTAQEPSKRAWYIYVVDSQNGLIQGFQENRTK